MGLPCAPPAPARDARAVLASVRSVSPPDPDARLSTRPFQVVVAATLACFLAFGATLPVVPRFVVDELGHGAVAVGVVFAVHALAAVLIRPAVGRVGDRYGRRPLVLLGGAVTAVALLGHLAVASLASLLVLRALAGVGQAAVVVGTATRALDLAPPGRHGEASSYVMVAVQLGFGLGPLAGELALRGAGYPAVWALAAAGSGLVVLLGARIPRADVPAAVTIRTLLHPAAVVPGIVFGIGSLGFIGFLAFAPLYADQLGLVAVAPVFLLCSGTIAVIRIVGARIPDRLGAVTAGTAALVLVVIGLLAMGAMATPVGLYLGVLVLAAGTAVFAPAMALAAVQGVPAGERAQVMATFTLFLDLASAVGPAVLGFTAAQAGFSATFLAAAAAAIVSMVLLRRWLAPRLAARSGASGHPAPLAAPSWWWPRPRRTG